jgi:hypothetical protein
MRICNIFFLILTLLAVPSVIRGQNLSASKLKVIISAIKGTVGKPDTIKLNSANGSKKIDDLSIIGMHANFFSIISTKPKHIQPGKPEKIIVKFQPDANFTGIARATLHIKGTDLKIELIGLSTKGLEGENEAPLSLIVDALGYTINVGWTTLAGNLNPALQGEELAPAIFKKVHQGKPVEMIPVARYSPDFPLNFGLFTNTNSGPRQHQRGILAAANKFPEHQTLFPGFSESTNAFDPGDEEFGFYAISPSHTVYSDDTWNILFYPTHAAHAVRIYPIRNKDGSMVPDVFLVCMEEASNGDYNDYVFLVRNIQPVFFEEKFSSLLNGKNLDGWYTWLESKGKNNDPEKIFTIQPDGVLHDTGKEAGYIMTQKGFENYHFRLQFKWGEDRWAPREDDKRDSGICYNIPMDEMDKIWPQSIECQIQESDVGDFWLLGYSTIQVNGKQNAPYLHTRMEKRKDAEKPNGEWNTVEVISFNGKCAHIVNGVVVNYGENSSLIGGRILLQSEYAEIYYRSVTIREF